MIAGRIAQRMRDDGILGALAAARRTVGRGVFRMRGSRPWKRATLDLARSGGLGDVLMCTPIIREIKRRNPDCYIRFFTDYGSLVDGLPQFDEVLPFSARRWNTFHLEYRAPVPVGVHLAQAMADDIGLRIDDCRPECFIHPQALAEARSLLHAALIDGTGRPLVVVQRKASGWTGNKEWPENYWRELSLRLRERVMLVEIGQHDGLPSPIAGHMDLRGKTTVEQMAAIVSEADLLIGPDSGPVHIAAATSTPAIVIYGGYIHPSHTRYDGNVPFYTPVPCAPCWLQEPCSYSMRCMTPIRPETVEQAAIRVLGMANPGVA